SVLRTLREELSLQRARNHFKLASLHELLKFSRTDGTVEGNGLHCNSIIGCQCKMLRLYQTLVNGGSSPAAAPGRPCQPAPGGRYARRGTNTAFAMPLLSTYHTVAREAVLQRE